MKAMKTNKKILVISIGMAVALAILPFGSVIGAQVLKSSKRGLATPLYNVCLNKDKNIVSNYLGKGEKPSVTLPKISDINAAIARIFGKLNKIDSNKLFDLVNKIKSNPALLKAAFEKTKNSLHLSAIVEKLSGAITEKNGKLATLGCPPLPSVKEFGFFGCIIIYLLLILVCLAVTIMICWWI
jgi:hypothetical protein